MPETAEADGLIWKEDLKIKFFRRAFRESEISLPRRQLKILLAQKFLK